MQKLEPPQYSLVRPLFRELAVLHLTVEAVLAGDAPGDVWVDNADEPRVGFLSGAEGYYLAGDAGQESAYAGLQEVIPPRAYLIPEPAWEPVLEQVWKNRWARRHGRKHLRLCEPKLSPGSAPLPAGFELLPVDAALLAQTDLRNQENVVEWVEDWHSRAYFLEHGFGYTVREGDTLASWSLADVVSGPRAEIGIMTDAAYRRRGLATAVVAATVEAALARGLTHIGWHCVATNVGSLGVAHKVGFEVVADYAAYCDWLPVESPNGMTPSEAEAWARHFERAAEDRAGYAFTAAEAWTLAGDVERALVNLRRLAAAGWKGERAWFETNWVFAPLRDMGEFQRLTQGLIRD